MPTYHPKPLDTKSAILAPSLLDLVEYLARNTHEVWAAGRVREGWTFGPSRDDVLKQHPGLVPYEQLSESEKNFDRQTAVETVKLITTLGYGIQPPAYLVHPESAADVSDAQPPPALWALIDLWRRLGPGRCHGAAAVYLRIGERALALGEYLLAHDVLKEGLRYHPGDVLLRQRQGLAQARSGAVAAAVAIFEELLAEGHRDEETLGLLARCHKDMAEQAANPADATQWLTRAADTYESAFQLNGGAWQAINVATLAECLDQTDRMIAFAKRAKTIGLERLAAAATGDDSYWDLATVGEACLLLREFEDAERYYTQAAAVAAGRYGHLNATRRNVRMIVRHRGVEEAAQAQTLRRVLAMPRVVVFSGHMIDAPGRAVPRFPAIIEQAVALQIKSALAEMNCGFGYASAAGGADILFLEAVLERGGEANIVLPYEADRFCANCVAIFGREWEDRFRRLLASKGVRVVTTSQGPVAEGIANEYANHFTFGLAGIRAWQLGAELAPLAVWDGAAGDGPGGTADAVARWRACGCSATIIDTRALLQAAGIEPAMAANHQALGASAAETDHSGDEPSVEAPAVKPRMVAMVFSDIVGYTKLAEAEIPLLIQHMLGPVAALAGQRGRTPLHMSSWGDAFYFVFENVVEAGEFALDLRDMVEKTDWAALGFAHRLALRTALHVGPVYSYLNPIANRPDFIGTHVSRAARIEPITPSGQVYASEIFAAIAFAERAEGFRCEYVGKIGLAKDYGEFPVYHVRRRARN